MFILGLFTGSIHINFMVTSNKIKKCNLLIVHIYVSIKRFLTYLLLRYRSMVIIITHSNFSTEISKTMPLRVHSNTHAPTHAYVACLLC